MLIELECAIVSFIDGVPSRNNQQELFKDKRIYFILFKDKRIYFILFKDKRLYFTYGIHLKWAYKYTPEDMKAIKTAFVKDPHCVGIGEMGYDLTQGCSAFVDKQMKLFKEQLHYYLKKELWQTVLVIDC